MTLESKLLKIINTVLSNRGRKKVKALVSKQNLRDDIGFDSLDLAELTVRVEAAFGVDIFADGYISTVAQVIKKIK